MPIWWRLPAHTPRRAFSRALFNAGNSMAARMPMMAMTTRSSIKVNAREETPTRRDRESWKRELICLRISTPVGLCQRENALTNELTLAALGFTMIDTCQCSASSGRCKKGRHTPHPPSPPRGEESDETRGVRAKVLKDVATALRRRAGMRPDRAGRLQ